MSREEMIGTYDLKDRLAYYAGDLEAIYNALDIFRINEIENKEHDQTLRVILLALESISDSLEKESDNL